MMLGHNDDNLARMNAARDPTCRQDALFYGGWAVAIIIAGLLFWLFVNAAADAALASVAQTAECHPECAVGPYHPQEEAR